MYDAWIHSAPFPWKSHLERYFPLKLDTHTHTHKKRISNILSKAEFSGYESHLGIWQFILKKMLNRPIPTGPEGWEWIQTLTKINRFNPKRFRDVSEPLRITVFILTLNSIQEESQVFCGNHGSLLENVHSWPRCLVIFVSPSWVKAGWRRR